MRSLLLLAACAVSVSAQPASWEFPTSGSTVSLSAERPLFDDDSFAGNTDFGPLTSAWLFSTTQAVGPVRLVGELPFAYGSIENTILGVDDVSGFALGNAQLGVEADLLVAPVTVGGYVRIPTFTSEDEGGGVAQIIGILSDAERVGLYAEDLVTVSAMIEGRPSILAVPGLSFRLRATPQLLVATEDDILADDVEVVIGYAAHAFFSTGVARLGAGLSGAGIVTEDVDDRNQVFIGLLGDVGLGPVRVGATGRLPIAGESKDLINGVVGLRLTYGVD